MFPLLEYVDNLITNDLIPYSHSDVASARLSLLQPTHMVDYAMDIYRELHGMEVEIPKEMEEKKAKVYQRLEELRDGSSVFDELLSDEAEKTRLMQNNQWTVAGLQSSKYKISPNTITTYRELAKFNYDCGDYQTAREMINSYLSLFASPPASNAEDDDDSQQQQQKSKDNTTAENAGHPQMYHLREITTDLLRVLWGKLSCEILVESWEDAHRALVAVKTALETLVSQSKLTALEALEQRTWLLHWSLFVFWNDSSKGLENMVELFKTERYLQAVTTDAPHLLRYLTAAVLLSKRRVLKSSSAGGNEARRLMKDLVRVMQHCDYTDPIVEFVDCLCVKFDFEMAQKKLAECEAVLTTDFFLCKQTALFMEEARVFVFENYCRIHHKIDLAALGDKLAMDQSNAERWIVDLIRNALLDAKIDGEERCVVMGGDSVSVYEQVMEKTRDLNVRSGSMVTNLGNLIAEARKEKKKRERAALEEDYDD